MPLPSLFRFLFFFLLYSLSTVDSFLEVLDLDEASCAGRRSSPGVSPPRRVDAWLAYRILSAVLVPVNDLGTQTYEYYCRVDGMVSRIS